MDVKVEVKNLLVPQWSPWVPVEMDEETCKRLDFNNPRSTSIGLRYLGTADGTIDTLLLVKLMAYECSRCSNTHYMVELTTHGTRIDLGNVKEQALIILAGQDITEASLTDEALARVAALKWVHDWLSHATKAFGMMVDYPPDMRKEGTEAETPLSN